MSLPSLVFRHALLLAVALSGIACGGGAPLYPARPPSTPGEPIADPTPARIVVHATLTSAGLRQALDDQVPRAGDGTVPILGKERRFEWKREAFAVHFDRGRIRLDLHVLASLDAPLTRLEFPLDLRISAEPVLTSEYTARLQSLEVNVSSTDSRLRVAEKVGGVLDMIRKALEGKLDEFAYDLKPVLSDLYARVDAPLELPLGDAKGCAELHVLGVEAGPTVLADGLEKDLALVVAPRVTLPCAHTGADRAKLPALANTSTLQGGPFTVTVPIAAHYDELAKAMSMAFTDGKLFFSEEHPELYLEKPELYAGKDQLVLKLHVGGAAKTPFGSTDMSGDIFMTGHPSVVDNELRIADLEPTIESKNILLKLKAALDGNKIRDEARNALRLDLGARLASVRDKLSKDLDLGDGKACVEAAVDKIEITGIHVHGSYLRVYVAATARAAMHVPCRKDAEPAGGS